MVHKKNVVFILAPTNSGSTWLYEALDYCKYVVSFCPRETTTRLQKHFRITPWRDPYISRLFTEYKITSKSVNWKKFKDIFFNRLDKKWQRLDENVEFKDLIYLAKGAFFLVLDDYIYETFSDCNLYFIIMIRDPYASIEGYVRRLREDKHRSHEGNVDLLNNASQHWVNCVRMQCNTMRKYKDCSVFIKYEDLCKNPLDVSKDIQLKIPGLDDIDFGRAYGGPRIVENLPDQNKIFNFNKKQIDNLSSSQIEQINEVLNRKENIKVVKLSGYDLL